MIKNFENIRKYSCVLMVMVLIGTSCSLPKPESAQETEDPALFIAQTQTAIYVEQFLTSTVEGNPQSETPNTTPQAVNELTSTTTTLHESPTPTITNTPPQSPPNCTDKAKFIDETVPDESTFTPGEAFVKSWTLQNVGTCTWTSEYALVFSEGEQMGGASPIPFTGNILPEGQVTLSVTLAAPQAPGEYESHWMLRNNRGQNFALGKDADISFWVKISVSPNTNSLDLGSPTYIDTFENNKSIWYLGSDSTTKFQIENGQMVMTAIKSAGDQWRIAEIGYLDNFYLEAEFTTGSGCSGKDSYGLIVRAPDQADNIIDSTYVFSFSCDGKYRIYLMDNGDFIGLVNWTSSSQIKSGPNQSNTMGIYAKGNLLQLYANGNLIAEITDSTLSTGYFGLVIRSEVTANFQVAVGKISYWDLP